MRVRTASATASLVMIALSVTACSGGSSPTAAGTKAAGSPAAVASNAGAGTTSAAKVPTNFDVCAALPVADASRLTGLTFTTSKSSSVENQVFDCEYDSTGAALLQISVTTQAAKLDFDGDISAISTFVKPNKVSGVGDEAYSLPDPNGPGGSAGAAAFASYGALFGNVYIKIGGEYVTPDQGKAIVDELHSKM